MNRIDAIRGAAVKLFLEKGYSATSMRDIAAQAGINSATIYHYFPSKQDILVYVISASWSEVVKQLELRMEKVQGSWTDRLHAFIDFHAEWQCLHRDEVRVAASELRSLENGSQATVNAGRNRYERILQDVLQQGCDAGEFHLKDLAVTSFALLQMLAGISRWYRPGGRLNPPEIAGLYWQMVRSIVRARAPATPAGNQPV